MAVASAVVTVTNIQNGQSEIRVKGTVAIGANPLTYATGGIPMSFAGFDTIKSSGPPTFVTVQSQKAVASPNTAEYLYDFLPGLGMSDGKLQVITGAAAQSALAELNAGAVPAGVSGDNIVFEACFPRL